MGHLGCFSCHCMILRCFQLISLAAVTAPLHQHNYDKPYFSLVIFLPCFSGLISSSNPTQKTAFIDLEMASAAWFLCSGVP
jgi:hypothetical protein